MSTQKQNQQIAGDDMAQLYDLFMIDIEPDLLTDMVPYLDQVYSWETPEQRTKRESWYKEAFEICKKRLQKFFDLWTSEIHQVKAAFNRTQRRNEENERAEELQNIEHSLDTE